MRQSSYDFDDTVVVEKVLSQLERGCIFSGRLSDGQPIRVKFAGADTQSLPGDTFHVRGLLGHHRDKFGKTVVQIDSKHMRRVVTPGALLRPWLERLPNIGETRADRLIAAFGHDLQTVLSDMGRASEVAKLIEPTKPALAAKITAQLYAAVATQAGADKIRSTEVEFLTFLETMGMQESRVAGQIWRFMAGFDAVDRLKRNPYVPACLMDWKPADRIGQRLLRAANEGADLHCHPNRLAGALNSVWRELLSEGDTAATEETVKDLLANRGVDPDTTLRLAEENSSLRRIGALLRAPGAAWLEDQVVSALLSIENTSPTVPIPSGQALESLVYDAELETGLTLTAEQHAAVVLLLTLPVAALQGGAGVGKTTVMKVLATAWERLGGDVVMGALAGKAALTLSKGASTSARPRLAYTIARLIGMAQRQGLQAENPAFKRPTSDVDFTSKSLLVVDEAGMLDTPSLHKLLSLMPQGARLLFAGDEGQLPPVGIGRVFHDVVAEGSRVARLTQVLRQAADSDIPKVAALVRQGQTPVLDSWTGQAKGVFLVPFGELESVQRQLRGKSELMVIAARKATVEAINESESLEARSTTTPTRRLGPLATVAVGDPVVATANRYQEGLFNGLLGVVDSIAGPEVAIRWDGEREPRSLPQAAEADIELAYAITCHRAQGSGSQAVVIVVESSRLVTREWIYTAITRSRELVIVVGDSEVLTKSLARRTTRTTGFSLRARIPMGAAHVGRRP
ncbi:ATP-dependent RecD-like DNA helicase [Rhodoferax sp. BLA1]|uniref:AAA family ATPase n=1 Tax=Rhodoferax sp. BLA1 TaxID=2576062 RepID=UPI0015D384FA|nr:ATP-dependent RecD-like DNA helicase [Rhodoferax sp. BLA1]